MDTPIYDELAEKLGVYIPDPLDLNPLSSLLPVTAAADVTMTMPVVTDDPTDVYPPEGEHRHGGVVHVGGESS